MGNPNLDSLLVYYRYIRRKSKSQLTRYPMPKAQPGTFLGGESKSHNVILIGSGGTGEKNNLSCQPPHLEKVFSP